MNDYNRKKKQPFKQSTHGPAPTSSSDPGPRPPKSPRYRRSQSIDRRSVLRRRERGARAGKGLGPRLQVGQVLRAAEAVQTLLRQVRMKVEEIPGPGLLRRIGDEAEDVVARGVVQAGVQREGDAADGDAALGAVAVADGVGAAEIREPHHDFVVVGEAVRGGGLRVGEHVVGDVGLEVVIVVVGGVGPGPGRGDGMDVGDGHGGEVQGDVGVGLDAVGAVMGE